MAKRRKQPDILFHDIARFRSTLADRMMKPYGLTMSQALVLRHLFSVGDMTQTELARQMEIGTVATGGLIDRLEARGVVERFPDPTDRRANRVRLTDDAIPLIRIMAACHTELEKAGWQGIPEAKVVEMTAYLQQVRQNLLDALNQPAETHANRMR